MGIKNFDILDKQIFPVGEYGVMIRTQEMYFKEDVTNRKTYLANLLFYKDGYQMGVVPDKKLELHTRLPITMHQRIAMVDIPKDGVELIFIDGSSGKKWNYVVPLERIQTYQEFMNLLAYTIVKM